jgi:hypothetical protein
LDIFRISVISSRGGLGLGNVMFTCSLTDYGFCSELTLLMVLRRIYYCGYWMFVAES